MIPEWPEFVKIKFKHWLDTNHNAVKFYTKDQLCVIFYEELLLNIVEAIKPCLKFLGYNKIPPKIAKCLTANQEGQFHRPQRPPEEIEIIIQQIPTHILDEMGHQKIYPCKICSKIPFILNMVNSYMLEY